MKRNLIIGISALVFSFGLFSCASHADVVGQNEAPSVTPDNSHQENNDTKSVNDKGVYNGPPLNTPASEMKRTIPADHIQQMKKNK